MVIDANLLLVLVVGERHPEYLGHRKHLKAFQSSDYERLVAYLRHFPKVLVTPNSVTECSNFLKDAEQDDYARDTLRHLLDDGTLTLAEVYVESVLACQRKEFNWLGVSDCANLILLDKETSLVTMDERLACAAKAINTDSVNFNHMRDLLKYV